MQMPRGVPVATVAINNATNAGLLAVRVMGIRDADLLARWVFFSLLSLEVIQNCVGYETKKKRTLGDKSCMS